MTLINALLVAHIIVVGYWLGAEFVINSTFRHVTVASSMPVADRQSLFDHVMNTDQHVRYALILQLGLGTALGGLLGLIPGGNVVVVLGGLGAVLFLALVEVTHRARKSKRGAIFAKADRIVRYVVIAAITLFGLYGLAGRINLPGWLGVKLLLFALVIVCGLRIRFELMGYLDAWGKLRESGSSDAIEQQLLRYYRRATNTLLLLWLGIAAITALSIVKPF